MNIVDNTEYAWITLVGTCLVIIRSDNGFGLVTELNGGGDWRGADMCGFIEIQNGAESFGAIVVYVLKPAEMQASVHSVMKRQGTS